MRKEGKWRNRNLVIDIRPKWPYILYTSMSRFTHIDTKRAVILFPFLIPQTTLDSWPRIKISLCSITPWFYSAVHNCRIEYSVSYKFYRWLLFILLKLHAFLCHNVWAITLIFSSLALRLLRVYWIYSLRLIASVTDRGTTGTKGTCLGPRETFCRYI